MTNRDPCSRPAAPTIAFYDGGCPLCRKEVDHYRRLDVAGRIEWVDITRRQRLIKALGVSFDDAMRRMHVLGSDGLLRDGAAAFVALWRELPYYRTVAALVYATRSVPVLDRLYRVFAARRYRSRCPGGACRTES